jgi:hypothetical protein
MFGDDLIFDDFPRWSSNLKESTDATKRFEAMAATIGQSQWHKYFWEIPVSGDDFYLIPFTSPDNGPLAGVVRYRNWFEFDSEPIPGSNFENIPEILRQREQWIWLAPSDNKAASRHLPHLCRGVKDGDGLLQHNWMRFSSIDWHYKNDPCGNGYVLKDEVIVDNLRLVAIEISTKSGLNNNDIRNLWIALGKPYLEYSKDCHGWTILGLVNQQLPTINCDGVKIFTGGDFVELSGLGAEGTLIDITKEVLACHAYRFPSTTHKKTIFNPRPNTPREIARLKDMLQFISADCSYDRYMRVVWGILSTGWPEAEQIALDWSLTAKHRFEQKTFNDLVRCYDPDRSGSTTMGTIYHLARAGGWHG